jgi:hypothetical protein
MTTTDPGGRRSDSCKRPTCALPKPAPGCAEWSCQRRAWYEYSAASKKRPRICTAALTSGQSMSAKWAPGQFGQVDQDGLGVDLDGSLPRHRGCDAQGIRGCAPSHQCRRLLARSARAGSAGLYRKRPSRRWHLSGRAAAPGKRRKFDAVNSSHWPSAGGSGPTPTQARSATGCLQSFGASVEWECGNCAAHCPSRG